MPPQNPARPLSLFVAAVTGGVMGAMIVEIMLAHRGVEFTDALRGALGGGVRMYAAFAWWAVPGAAFVASFAIAAVLSRISTGSWLCLRSLGWIAAAALALALARIGDLAALGARDRRTACRRDLHGDARRHDDGVVRGAVRGARLTSRR